MSNENKKTAPLPSDIISNTDPNVPNPPEIKVSDVQAESDVKLQKEFVDDTETANKKILQFVAKLKKSKFTVVFTGAGVSTNTKRLADFRGDKGLIANRPPLVQMGIAETKMDSIMPTFTHYCLKILKDKGFVHKIITSNHDGLHNKTNIANEDIVDLFGNVYVEKCRKCKARYVRKTVVSHLHRKCDRFPECKGKLQREKCDMGNSVSAKYLRKATEIAQQSTLSLVLGSSMTISPFCELPEMATKCDGKNGKNVRNYVLVTRQETDYDRFAFLCVHLDVDDFMFGVMKELGLESECTQFVYAQIFECNVRMEANNEMIRFGLNSKECNEGLPFIQSCALQIVRRDSKGLSEEKSEGNGCEIVREYELQKMKDMNWVFEIMKGSFLNALGNGCEIRVEIEWDKGFGLENYQRVIFENVDWKSDAISDVLQLEICKVVKYE